MQSLKLPAALRPLAVRDFGRLWAAVGLGLLGDGVFLVAAAWQAYRLSNSPGALAAVGVAWTLPQVLLLLLGGVLGDRADRRTVLYASTALRAASLGATGALAASGALRPWSLVALVVLYGTGEALFAPAFGAIVPQLVPERMLLEANALDSVLRPVAQRLIGPALGGAAIAAVGAPGAFLAAAAAFAVSAAVLGRIRACPPGEASAAGVVPELREGLRFVRAQVWLLGTLLVAAAVMFLIYGPLQVLLPFIVKNGLHGSAATLGLVLAVYGGGAVVAALALAARGGGRPRLAHVYASWAVAIAAMGGYALAANVWEAMIAAAVSGAALAVANVAWTTLLQTHVPGRLLARVTSVDWFVSTSLAPLSFAATGPVAAALGARTTLLAAALAGGAVMGLAALAAWTRRLGAQQALRLPRESAEAGSPG